MEKPVVDKVMEEIKQTKNADNVQNSVAIFDSEISPDSQSKQNVLDSRRLLRQYGGVKWHDTVNDVLQATIKADSETALITFYAMLSAFTERDQINLLFNAPSSSGKTYIPGEVSRLFPKSSLIKLGSVSATAFFHDYGQFDKETNTYRLDMSRKVYLFLDQPHFQLLEKLRPLLSHDDKEIHVKITDKSQKHGLRTKNIVIVGFPVVIFCSARLNMDQQEATRFFLLSPETASQEKNEAAVLEALSRIADFDAYQKNLNEDTDRLRVQSLIAALQGSFVQEVKIQDQEYFMDLFRKTLVNGEFQSRHSRDIQRVAGLAKAIALLDLPNNIDQSFIDGMSNSITVLKKHIDIAMSLWGSVAEPQQFNLPPFVYSVYKQVITPLFEDNKLGDTYAGITRSDISAKYRSVFKRNLPEHQLRREILPMLFDAGLILEEQDPTDKRKMLIYPTIPSQLSVGIEKKSIGSSLQSKQQSEIRDENEINYEDYDIPAGV